MKRALLLVAALGGIRWWLLREHGLPSLNKMARQEGVTMWSAYRNGRIRRG
jgi:hypothetical protein